jgi:hypothetical protein
MASSTDGFAGRLANLTVSAASSSTGTYLGGMRGVTFEVTMEPTDFTNFDSSAWKQHMDGDRSWTLTADAVVLSTALAGHSQNTLREALSSGARKYMLFQNSTAGGAKDYKGWAYITGWSQVASQGEPQMHNFSAIGDGAYTEA